MLAEIHNADILFRCDATVDQFIDVIEGKRSYIPCLYVRHFFFFFHFQFEIGFGTLTSLLTQISSFSLSYGTLNPALQ